MINDKFIDPVDKDKDVKEDKSLLGELKAIDVTGLSIRDFKTLAPRTTTGPHPFDGYSYPMGKVEDSNSNKINATYIVAFLPHVRQDPSGKDYTVRTEYAMDEVIDFGPYAGKTLQQINKIDKEYVLNVIRAGKQKLAPIKTVHNRYIMDYVSGRALDVVFDRNIKLTDGEMPNCAIVKEHSVRAQIIWKLQERTGAIKVDERYALLDTQQGNRLLNVFKMIVRPQQLQQKLVGLVTGETELPEGQNLDDALGGG